MLEIHPCRREELYKNHLSKISDIKFTFRELDVIACIYHNRGKKKIGSLLNVSYRTVGSHVRNIMAKLGNSSRDYIIDFIEKSGKLNYLKKYYLNLIVEDAFKKKLNRIKSNNRTPKEIILPESNKLTEDEISLFEKIKEYLLLANIKFTNLLEDNTKDKQDILIYTEGEFDKQQTNLREINFGINESIENNFYFYMLNLISTILNEANIEEYQKEFKKEYNSLMKSFMNNGNLFEEETNKPSNTKIIKQAIYYFLVFLLSIYIIYFFSNGSHIIQEKFTQSESWNLPLEIEHYIDRSKIVEEIWDSLKHNQDHKTPTSLVGLHGLGGIGKTTLANNIIHHPKKKYNFKAWFSSETKELLENDYLDLGTKHNLFTQKMSSKQKIRSVKEWISKKDKALLVYDNVPDVEMIKEYLPNRGDIIITSRNYLLPGALEIDVMSEKESIKLLSSLLPKDIRKKEGYNEEVAILANKLGYLPLALSQAGAYIKYNKLSLNQYLSLYENQQRELLSDNTMPAMDNHLPAYVTWDISIAKLLKEESGEEALKLLEFISCCYPENIPKKLLMQYMYNNTDEESALKIHRLLTQIRRYSLIKLYEDSISIHRIMQSYIKKRMGNKKEQYIEKKIFKSIKYFFPEDKLTLAIEDLHLLISQIDHLKNKGLNIKDKYDLILMIGRAHYVCGNYLKGLEILKKLENDKENPNVTKMQLLKLKLYYAMLSRAVGDFDKSINLFEYIIKNYDKSMENKIVSLATIYYQIGKTARVRCNYNKSKYYLIKSLNEKVKKHGRDSEEVACILHQLGRVENDLKNYEKSRQVLEESLSIKRKKFGDHSIQTSYTYCQLGATLNQLGLHKESLKLL